MTERDPNPTDIVWQRDEIESPCIRVCVLHPSERLCMGCYRTSAEIASWSRLTPAERREVMDDLPARGLRVEGARPPRRGGRAARLRGER